VSQNATKCCKFRPLNEIPKAKKERKENGGLDFGVGPAPAFWDLITGLGRPFLAFHRHHPRQGIEDGPRIARFP
jgi:hypothetical protein